MFTFRPVAAACALITVLAASAAADPGPRVRSSHPRLARLLAVGERQSATFRDLLRRLQASDVIVHVEEAPPGRVVDGGLQFVTSTALARYLRVTMRLDLHTIDLVALLGHELRHAVEVAEHGEVRDESSFRRYYEATGLLTHRGSLVTYDTRAAVVAGQRVAIELRLGHAWEVPVAAR